MARDTIKTLKRGKNEKLSKRKVYQRNNDNRIIYFYFMYIKKDIFCSKT